jgi:hypothetical protein
VNSLPFRFHHLGLAARRVEPAKHFAQILGYQLGPEVHDPLQNVKLVMCTHSTMPAMELVTPTDEPGPLNSLLRQSTELVYHLCYEVPRIEEALTFIRAKVASFRCVAEPKPAVLFGERLVGFYLLPGAGLVELLEAT